MRGDRRGECTAGEMAEESSLQGSQPSAASRCEAVGPVKCPVCLVILTGLLRLYAQPQTRAPAAGRAVSRAAGPAFETHQKELHQIIGANSVVLALCSSRCETRKEAETVGNTGTMRLPLLSRAPQPATCIPLSGTWAKRVCALKVIVRKSWITEHRTGGNSLV